MKGYAMFLFLDLVFGKTIFSLIGSRQSQQRRIRMAIFTKKLGQFKQWTGEKFGSTGKTTKPAEIKQLQNETRSRFEGLENIRVALKGYSKALDDNRNSTMSMLAHSMTVHSNYHEDTDFGLLLVALGSGLSSISQNQNQFSEEIRLGLLMAVESVLNEVKEFERLRAKLKNRRLDHDANYNKLQKTGSKQDLALEEKVKTTQFKYQETLKKLEELMIGVARQEIALIDPMIEFLENQNNFYKRCLEASTDTLKKLKEGKEGLKNIDYSTLSFRKELERDDSEACEEVELVLDSESDGSSLKTDSVPTSAKSEDAQPVTAQKIIKIVRAKHNFEAEAPNELSIQKGDLIKVTKMIDEGWWIGECNGRSGMFPANYTTENIEEPKQIQSSEPSEFKEIEGTPTEAAVAKPAVQPGFSYLPPGAPITFIGRKQQQLKQSEEEATSTSVAVECSECDCDDFCANVFKPGHCNNCFHKH